MSESGKEQRPDTVLKDDKTRKLKHWGLGLIAIGLVLELSPVFLPISLLRQWLSGWTDLLQIILPIIGMVPCALGLILLAKAKGQSGVFGMLALAPVVGPLLGILSIILIDACIHKNSWRIGASYIATVLVLGILAAIAIPNLLPNHHEEKHRHQSEAKIGLAGVFAYAAAMKEERKTFVISNISELEYDRTGSARYIPWLTSGMEWKLEHIRAGNARHTFWYSVNGVPAKINVVSSGRAGGCDGPPTTVKVAASVTGFTAAAKGNIDGDPTCDEWSINDSRHLKNTLNDVAE